VVDTRGALRPLNSFLGDREESIAKRAIVHVVHEREIDRFVVIYGPGQTSFPSPVVIGTTGVLSTTGETIRTHAVNRNTARCSRDTLTSPDDKRYEHGCRPAPVRNATDDRLRTFTSRARRGSQQTKSVK